MKTTFHIPDELAEQARRHGISLSEVARQALVRAVRDAEIFAEPALQDDTRFIAGILVRGLSPDQVNELAKVLQRMEEQPAV